MNISKDDIVRKLSRKTNLTQVDVRKVVEGLLEEVSSQLSEGNRVVFRGFGTFEVQYRAPRMGRNPHTNEEIPIKGKNKPIFKAGIEMEEAVNGNDEGE